VGKVKRDGYVFLSWIGDHSPKHVHKDGELIVKWDIESWMPMKGKANRAILKLLKELLDEKKI